MNVKLVDLLLGNNIYFCHSSDSFILQVTQRLYRKLAYMFYKLFRFAIVLVGFSELKT